MSDRGDTRVASQRRVAVVGAGFIADYHLAALRRVPDVEVVGLYDRDVQRSGRVAAQWAIAPAATLDELLQRKPDVVHILTPPPFHAPVAAACLTAGAHVLLEKPAAVSSEECEELQRIAVDRGRVVGVNHNAVYQPAFRTVTEWVRDWSLGKPEHVTVWWNVPLHQFQQRRFEHWMFGSPVNILLEQAVHPLSQITYLLGRPLEFAVLASDEILLPSGAPFQRTWNVNLRCERGTANCFLSFGRGYFENALHVIGEDGAAWADLRRNTVRRAAKTRYVEQVDDLVNGAGGAWQQLTGASGNFTRYCLAFLKLRPRSDAFYTSMSDSIMAFHSAIRAGVPVPVSLEFGALLVAACEQIAAASVIAARDSIGSPL